MLACAGVFHGWGHRNFASPFLFPWPCIVWLFLFQHLKKCLSWQRFNSRSSLGSAIFQYLSHIYSESSSNELFLQWVEWLKVCGSRQRVLWKVAAEESHLQWGEHILHHTFYTKMKHPPWSTMYRCVLSYFSYPRKKLGPNLAVCVFCLHQAWKRPS